MSKSFVIFESAKKISKVQKIAKTCQKIPKGANKKF